MYKSNRCVAIRIIKYIYIKGVGRLGEERGGGEFGFKGTKM